MRHKRRFEIEEVANGWLLTVDHYPEDVDLSPWPKDASDIFTDPADLMARLQEHIMPRPVAADVEYFRKFK